MELDCTSPETAVTTLAQIFNTTETELLSLLDGIRPCDGAAPSEDLIYEQVCEQFGPPSFPLNVTWFHGTRVEDHKLFLQHGILPKSGAREFIEPRLKELAKGLVAEGDNPFSFSVIAKQGEHDEGPFASLIRDVVIHSPGAYHNYLQSPEIVEDIAGALLGKNYDALLKRFKDVTKPYLVAFRAESQGDEISCALWYLKLISDGHSTIEAAAGANTCYCGNGITIFPDQIRSIEQIPDLSYQDAEGGIGGCCLY
jgi:hypothetical protein